MKRRVARIIATVVWLGTLVLLIPYDRIASFVCILLLVRLPLSIVDRPEFLFWVPISYLISVLVVLIASAMVVRLAENRKQVLFRVGLVDSLLVMTALILTFVFGW